MYLTFPQFVLLLFFGGVEQIYKNSEALRSQILNSGDKMVNSNPSDERDSVYPPSVSWLFDEKEWKRDNLDQYCFFAMFSYGIIFFWYFAPDDEEEVGVVESIFKDVFLFTILCQKFKICDRRAHCFCTFAPQHQKRSARQIGVELNTQMNRKEILQSFLWVKCLPILLCI